MNNIQLNMATINIVINFLISLYLIIIILQLIIIIN